MSKARLLWHFLFTRGRGHSYGPHPSQRADLHLPRGDGPHPVIVLLHGGSWRSRYGKRVMRALAGDLAAHGWAVWNVEYRRVGEGGGWPQTLEDVAAAIDLLPGLDPSLDLARVAYLGHSAGGQLALWAAGRTESPVEPRAVVALAGVCDLAGGYRAWGGGAVLGLMGGSPEAEPERYAHADPMAHVPLAMPVLLVHGVRDEVVSVKFSRAYADAARAAGGEVELVEVDGEQGRHRAHIYPGIPSWRGVLDWLGARVPLSRPVSAPTRPAA
jgi:acetyl esterase/lipase